VDVPQDFKDRVALVTGGTRGIGFGIAEELVARGARVAITARKPDELTEAVSRLDPDGAGAAIGVRGSADDAGHQAEAADRCVAELGGLDILVNNAGVNPQFGPLIAADLGAVRKTLEVNVVSALAWLQQAWRVWMQEHGGAVLNISSVGGVRVGPGLGAYNVSKAALIHLTKQLAIELGPSVRVNAIAPAVIRTHFARLLWEGREEAAEAYPMKRFGELTDTAKLAAFLLGPDATWITGETVVIDGGASHARAG
jgi:NAD(P)-dependent dehydrogenase (short-subunit alcohol dehydrogenase family)